MMLNEPSITLEAQDPKICNCCCSFQSERYSIVDGFEKEGAPCLIVMNQPTIKGGSFAGIKPAVIMMNIQTHEMPKLTS